MISHLFDFRTRLDKFHDSPDLLMVGWNEEKARIAWPEDQLITCETLANSITGAGCSQQELVCRLCRSLVAEAAAFPTRIEAR
jgi:hypothetical protein